MRGWRVDWGEDRPRAVRQPLPFVDHRSLAEVFAAEVFEHCRGCGCKLVVALRRPHDFCRGCGGKVSTAGNIVRVGEDGRGGGADG